MGIHYNDITVSGIEYLSVLKLNILQQVNSHAYAEIELEVEEEKGKKYLEQMHENELLSIGVPDVIYKGVIDTISLNYEHTYTVLKLRLVSASILWDVQKQNRSFQRIGESYGTLLKRAVGETGLIEVLGEDKTTEAMVAQYKETMWEFILRIASILEMPVYVDCKSTVPHVSLGMESSESQQNANVTGSSSGAGVTSGIVSLGGSMTGGSTISGVNTYMNKGELVSKYIGSAKTAMIPAKRQPSYVGKVVSGQVEEVEGDKIKVFINEWDSEYDGASNLLFPYSTLYSSEGSECGIYCMPVKYDPVRVFLPSAELKDVFASSSATMRGFSGDKEEKSFQTPAGMRVLFGKQGLTISCNKKKIGITLLKDGTVALESETTIGIRSMESLGFQANEGNINVESGKNIYVVTGNSMIALGEQEQGEQAILVADRISTE